METRARALEQARATALKARLEAAHKKLCEACANGGRIRMSIPTQPDDTDIVIGRALSEAIAYFTEAMLAVDPPPSGASPQAETSALARLREFVTQAQAGTKQRRKGQYYLGEIVGIQGTLNVLLAEIDKLAQQPTCRVCGGYGFVAQKQTIDDGWGEVDTCPACSDQPAPVSPVEPTPEPPQDGGNPK